MSEIRLRVMVIGAGLGGRCLAQGLRRRGVDVTVYERDDALLVRNQGYRLYIDPTGDSVLRESLPAELYELFRATAGYPPLRIVKLDDQLNATRVLEDDPDETPISVDRLTLRQILFEGLSDHVVFGKKLVRYETSEAGDGPVTHTSPTAPPPPATSWSPRTASTPLSSSSICRTPGSWTAEYVRSTARSRSTPTPSASSPTSCSTSSPLWWAPTSAT
ncbi:FAD-dependent oxidoreductase [Streptomyces sp. NPDC000888]